MNQILDCKVIRDTKLAEIKKQIKECKIVPSLAIVQVGDREDSTKYINNKVRVCTECGIKCEVIKLTYTVTTEELVKKVKEVQECVSAIIVQCPLPKHIDEKIVMEAINPLKDCDGLTRENISYLYSGQARIIPATAQGIIDLLDYYKIEVEGMDILLIGRSNLVNMPLFKLLLDRNATVTIAHSRTKDLQEKISSGRYNIIIGAIGQDRFLVKANAEYIIDVGINVDYLGKLHGDFNMEFCKCEYYTPVPSGVGLLTVEAVVSNILKCHKLQFQNS